MALLDELASYLQAEGLGTVGTTIYKGSFPLDTATTLDRPVLALVEVPGFPPMRSHDSPPSRYEQPVVQVASRGASYGYEAARVQADAAWQALDGLANQVLSGTAYLTVQALQSPFLLKWDEAHRPVLVFNVRCQRAL